MEFTRQQLDEVRKVLSEAHRQLEAPLTIDKLLAAAIELPKEALLKVWGTPVGWGGWSDDGGGAQAVREGRVVSWGGRAAPENGGPCTHLKPPPLLSHVLL